MVCQIGPVCPTALVVEGKIIHDPLPDMGIGQGTVQVEEGGFFSKGPHSFVVMRGAQQIQANLRRPRVGKEFGRGLFCSFSCGFFMLAHQLSAQDLTDCGFGELVAKFHL